MRRRRWRALRGAPAPSSRSASEAPSSYENSHPSARDECGDVEQHRRQGETAARADVLWTPDRVELLLEGFQPLEMVEVLGVAIEETADLVPGRGERVVLQPGERRCTEV